MSHDSSSHYITWIYKTQPAISHLPTISHRVAAHHLSRSVSDTLLYGPRGAGKTAVVQAALGSDTEQADVPAQQHTSDTERASTSNSPHQSDTPHQSQSLSPSTTGEDTITQQSSTDSEGEEETAHRGASTVIHTIDVPRVITTPVSELRHTQPYQAAVSTQSQSQPSSRRTLFLETLAHLCQTVPAEMTTDRTIVIHDAHFLPSGWHRPLARLLDTYPECRFVVETTHPAALSDRLLSRCTPTPIPAPSEETLATVCQTVFNRYSPENVTVPDMTLYESLARTVNGNLRHGITALELSLPPSEPLSQTASESASSSPAQGETPLEQSHSSHDSHQSQLSTDRVIRVATHLRCESVFRSLWQAVQNTDLDQAHSLCTQLLQSGYSPRDISRQLIQYALAGGTQPTLHARNPESTQTSPLPLSQLAQIDAQLPPDLATSSDARLYLTEVLATLASQ